MRAGCAFRVGSLAGRLARGSGMVGQRGCAHDHPAKKYRLLRALHHWRTRRRLWKTCGGDKAKHRLCESDGKYDTVHPGRSTLFVQL